MSSKQELSCAPYVRGDAASIMDWAQRLCKTAVQTVTPIDVLRAADATTAHGVGAGVHQVPPDEASCRLLLCPDRSERTEEAVQGVHAGALPKSALGHGLQSKISGVDSA